MKTRNFYPEYGGVYATAHRKIENTPPHQRQHLLTNEDQDRTQMGHGLLNLVALRRIAINAMQKRLERLPSGKFKRAGWDDACLCQILELL
jgi:hypothetical protein